MAPMIEELGYDILFLLSAEILASTFSGTLRSFATCSRTLRDASLPMLFHSIVLLISSSQRIPPHAIRKHARSLKYIGSFHSTNANSLGDYSGFGVEFEYLPNLTSVQFVNFRGGVPCKVLQHCLARPQVKSIQFTPMSAFTAVTPIARPTHQFPCGVTRLSYAMSLWRKLPDYLDPHTTLEDVFGLERTCLTNLLLGINYTVEALTLPMETAPIALMAECPWPCMRELTLSGRYFDESQVGQLPILLRRMPGIRMLVVQVAQRTRSFVRAPVLGRQHHGLSGTSGLQQLTIAYPDPDDMVFSLPAAGMTHLSLRDWPRYYEGSAPRAYAFQSIHPILAASECLSILRRMGPMPRLTSLELVYKVDEADEGLLQYVVHQYPTLQDFQLHRYRADDAPVDYVHIARTITSLTLLRTLRLHPNFPEESIAYCTIGAAREAWYDMLTERIGWKIVEIVQACPLLLHVGLLYHGDPHSLWFEFHPSRCAPPRLLCTYFNPRHQDNEPPPWLRSLPRR